MLSSLYVYISIYWGKRTLEAAVLDRGAWQHPGMMIQKVDVH